MKKKVCDENGMTLVEVLVAMMLLSLVVLTALTLLGVGMGVNDINNDRTQALNLAEQLMEQYKYSITVPDNWAGNEMTMLSATQYDRGNKTYIADVTAIKANPGSRPGLSENNVFAQITVTVWTKDKTRPQATLNTVVKVNVGT